MKTSVKFSSIIFLGVFFLMAVCFAGESPARRVAIVPTVNQTGRSAPEIEAYCTSALRENLRVPLNSLLGIHEYISEEEIKNALPELAQSHRMHKITPSRLQDAANLLDADLIVAFVITDMDETRTHNWDGDMILYSYISLQLVGYDRTKDAFVNLSRREYFHDEYSPSGSLKKLTKDAVWYLLQKADFKKDIFPLAKS